MGRKSTLFKFLNKTIGGIVILKSLGHKYSSDREIVLCKCLACKKEFEAQFHNVYRGNYKSCGCLQHALSNKNPKWKGIGDISASYFCSLRRGARIRNLCFNITLEEIWRLFLEQNKKCALSGKELKFSTFRNDYKANASLDRIDSSKGYTIDNVQWVDKDINFMKQSMNNQEFLNIVKKIYEVNNL